MKKTIKLADTPIEWDAQSLYDKAELYAERMLRAEADEDEKALWSALSLELLARAALANISPVLLSDGKKEGNIEHALGLAVKTPNFKPTSIVSEQVFTKLNSVVPDFIAQHKQFCSGHVGHRNAELHTGDTPFDEFKNWEGPYYQAVEVLLKTLGYALEDFIGDDEAKVARKQMAAHADMGAEAVRKDIAASQKAWAEFSDEEKARRVAEAKVWATRQTGHRVTCPSCESTALVTGEAVGAPERSIEEDIITETQVMLPHRFECVACDLKISGLAKLTVAGVGDRYKSTHSFDANEYYATEDQGGSFAEYEDDNNEPF